MFKKKLTKIFIAIPAVLLLCLITGYFGYERLVLYPFSLSHILPDPQAELQIVLPSVSKADEEHILPILKQKFSYLGQGHQTYAFLSEDKQYVLKFFNFARMDAREPLEWIPSLPFIAGYQKHLQERRDKKFNRLFNGYKNAYENDQDNTGVLYVHMQKTHHLQTDVLIIDASHHAYVIPLDNTIFILQKKVQATREVLDRLLKSGDIAEFKNKISQLISLYISEYKRGLYDSDHNIMSNTGFGASKAYRIDVGRLSHNPEIMLPENYQADLQKIIDKRILEWIQKRYPQYSSELHKDIQTQLKEAFSLKN